RARLAIFSQTLARERLQDFRWLDRGAPAFARKSLQHAVRGAAQGARIVGARSRDSSASARFGDAEQMGELEASRADREVGKRGHADRGERDSWSRRPG